MPLNTQQKRMILAMKRLNITVMAYCVRFKPRGKPLYCLVMKGIYGYFSIPENLFEQRAVEYFHTMSPSVSRLALNMTVDMPMLVSSQKHIDYLHSSADSENGFSCLKENIK